MSLSISDTQSLIRMLEDELRFYKRGEVALRRHLLTLDSCVDILPTSAAGQRVVKRIITDSMQDLVDKTVAHVGRFSIV